MLKTIDQADNILLVDFSNLAFISYHSKFESDNYIHNFCAKMIRIWEAIDDGLPISIVFAYDNFAKAKKLINPEYKANRPQLEFDPRPELKKMVRYFKATILENKENEADDVISVFCHQNTDKRISIVSTDKDMYQLKQLPNVNIFNPFKMKFVEPPFVLDKGFELTEWKHVVLWKSIFGDKSDNIRPIAPRILKKHIFASIIQSDGSINDFRVKYEQNKESISKATQDKMDSGWQNLNNNFRIVKLADTMQLIYTPCQGNPRFLASFLKKQKATSMLSYVHKFTGIM